MIRHLALILTALISTYCCAQSQVDITGTLIRQSGRTVLRVEGDVYHLRFPSTDLRTFAREHLGDDVRVQGALQLRTQNGQQQALIIPNKMDSLATGMAESDPPTEAELYDTSVDAADATPQRQQLPRDVHVPNPFYDRVDRRKTLVRDAPASEQGNPYYDRVDQRKREIRSDRRGYYRIQDSQDVLITPGGGVIIRNR